MNCQAAVCHLDQALARRQLFKKRKHPCMKSSNGSLEYGRQLMLAILNSPKLSTSPPAVVVGRDGS
jgi:hypothetical protein